MGDQDVFYRAGNIQFETLVDSKPSPNIYIRQGTCKQHGYGSYVDVVALRDALTEFITNGFKKEKEVTVKQSELDALKQKIQELEQRAK